MGSSPRVEGTSMRRSVKGLVETSEEMNIYDMDRLRHAHGVAERNLTIVDDSLAISMSARCARVTVFHPSRKLLMGATI